MAFHDWQVLTAFLRLYHLQVNTTETLDEKAA